MYEKENADKLAYRRNYKVNKSNDLIQKTRYKLSAQEQKVLLYTISKINPITQEREYTFSIKAICEICGVEFLGQNYANFKKTIKEIADKSFWIKQGNNQVLCRWYESVVLHEDNLTVSLKLNEYLMPYLIDLQENYTGYILEYILAMKSKYSIRLYEILKSYANLKEYTVKIEDLKDKLQCPEYAVYNNFKVRVIDTAIEEINKYTDLFVSYTPIRQNRKIVAIKFDIRQELETMRQVEKMLNRYYSLEGKKEKDNG